MVIILGVLIIAGAQLGLFFLGSRLMVRYIERKQEEILAPMRAELMALVKGEPCQTASVLLAVGKIVGQEAGRSAKAGLMADLGHGARLSNQAEEEGQLELISQAQPGIGNILGGLARRQRKGLMANPLVQLALQGLMSHASAPPAANPGNNERRGSFSL